MLITAADLFRFTAMTDIDARSRHLIRAVILFWSCLWPLSASSDDLLRPVETSIEASVRFEYLSFSPADVLQYRFVYVDSDYLRTLFESVESVERVRDERSLRIALFDDLFIETRLVKVSYFNDRSVVTGLFIATALPLNDELRKRAATEILLTKDGRVWANILWNSDRIGLYPVNMGPIHVIVQFDTQKPPATQ